MEVYIDREIIKTEFQKVFDKWDYKMANGFDMYDQENFLNDLVECIVEPDEPKPKELDVNIGSVK